MIYLGSIRNEHMKQENDGYPFNIPAIQHLNTLTFSKPVTYITGENGSGKSTLLEAIAIKLGMNPEGGGKNFNFSTYSSHSDLYKEIKAVRPNINYRDCWFFRAESYYNVASEIERLDSEPWGGGKIKAYYGNKNLHERSHGEGFMATFRYRMNGNGIYLFDEPESALSYHSQLVFLHRLKYLVENKAQIIIATHSPVILAYPDADIYEITSDGFTLQPYKETSIYRNMKAFMANTDLVVDELFGNCN